MATDTDAAQEAVAVVVPTAAAEKVRRALRDARLLDPALEPMRHGEEVLFALLPDADRAVVGHLAGPHGATVRSARFLRRIVRPSGYQDLLPLLRPEERALLPTSFDIVGHVAIVKLPDELVPRGPEIAGAIIAANRNIETVALDRGVQGDLRIRALEIIGGRADLRTIHREHGIEIEVALDRVYFSPRLATERMRLAARVRPGDSVLDLFAGVGAFVVLVARTRQPACIRAIDINPDAILLLEANLRRNRVPFGLVETLCADARAAAPRDRAWDHVVMNLPHDAPAFLDVAARAVSPRGEVHLYAMVERADRDRLVATWADQLGVLTDRPWRLLEARHVRNYSPTMDGLGFTFGAV